MPEGRIQRIDENREVAYILRRGRTYRAMLAEVEHRARVPSARVRFDLIRREGSEQAANVRLRVGTRTNRRQRRFGDLTGAKQPGSKVSGAAKRSYGVDVTTQPFRVATAWLQAMNDRDHDGAMSLYQARARLHTPDGSVVGRRSIRSELERLSMQTIEADGADIGGLDRYVAIHGHSRDGADRRVFLEIDHGSIVEQWVDREPDLPEPEAPRDDVQLVRRGDVPAGLGHYADQKIRHLMDHAGRTTRFARVKLTQADNPAVKLPALVEATIEFDNGLVRAHADGATFHEAIDQVADRLRRQVEHQHDRQRHRTSGLPPKDGGWHHGNRPRVETPYFNRPESEREIVRHKSIADDEMTIEEAAWDMAQLDYDFFLFVDLETGQDTLLERTPDDDTLVVRRLRSAATDEDPNSDEGATTSVVDYRVDEHVAPELLVSEAIGLLNEAGVPRLFFNNRASDRANVVYRRYDGHYGLIALSVDDVEPIGVDDGR